MPRPLVIKVSSHTSQPNKKATGTIDVTLLKENGTRSVSHPPILHSSLSHEEPTSSSLVRNLVSRYESSESSAPSNLLKYKSKSMIDLNEQAKLTKPETIITQDDTLYHKDYLDDEVYEERRNNFQQARSKFQNISEKGTLIRNEKFGLHDIRTKAQRLLEATKHDYFWFNEVVELLKHIVYENKPQSVNEIKQFLANYPENHVRSRTISIASTATCSYDEIELSENHADESCLKVSQMKRMYEDKVSQKPHLFTEVSKCAGNEQQHGRESQDQKDEQKFKVPLKYFGKQDEESDDCEHSDTNKNQVEDNSTNATVQSEVTQEIEAATSDGSDQYNGVYELDQHAQDYKEYLDHEDYETDASIAHDGDEKFESGHNVPDKLEPNERNEYNSSNNVHATAAISESGQEDPYFQNGESNESETSAYEVVTKTESEQDNPHYQSAENSEEYETGANSEGGQEVSHCQSEENTERSETAYERVAKSESGENISHCQGDEGYITSTSSVSETLAITENGQGLQTYEMDYEPKILPVHKEDEKAAAQQLATNEEAVKTIEEMMATIEECDKTIDSISVENKIEANYLNDILIQVLIKLDELKVYDDGVILTIRRKAFGFAQECIKKLKSKVFLDDII